MKNTVTQLALQSFVIITDIIVSIIISANFNIKLALIVSNYNNFTEYSLRVHMNICLNLTRQLLQKMKPQAPRSSFHQF